SDNPGSLRQGPSPLLHINATSYGVQGKIGALGVTYPSSLVSCFCPCNVPCSRSVSAIKAKVDKRMESRVVSPLIWPLAPICMSTTISHGGYGQLSLWVDLAPLVYVQQSLHQRPARAWLVARFRYQRYAEYGCSRRHAPDVDPRPPGFDLGIAQPQHCDVASRPHHDGAL